MQENPNLKCVVYARVSSKEQEREGYSIPAQRKFLNEYAIQNGFTVVKEFVDNETAKKAGRTNFGEMLKFLRKNTTVKTILVEKTDRLYRNFKDYVLLDEFEGLEIHLVKENTVLSDNSRSHEKFIHCIKVLMAKNYIDNLSEEVKKGQRQKAEQGEYPSKPPYGYKRNGGKEINIVEDESRVVKKAFEYYSDGHASLEAVVEKLYKEGLYYTAKQPKMYVSMLSRILKNPFYTGDFIYNKIYYKGKHPAIIKKEVFEKANQAMKKDNKPDTMRKHEFLFGGLIHCGECGSSVVADLKKGKYVYYFCCDKTKGCKQKKFYIREEEMEKMVESAIKDISLSQEEKNILLVALKDSYVDESKYHKEQVDKLQKRYDVLQNRLSQIYMDKLDGSITEEFWKQKHNEWTYEISLTLQKIQAHTNANHNYMEIGGQFLELLENLYSQYCNQTVEEKKKLLKIIFSNFVLKDGNIDYTYKKPFDIIAKGASCSKWWSLRNKCRTLEQGSVIDFDIKQRIVILSFKLAA